MLDYTGLFGEWSTGTAGPGLLAAGPPAPGDPPDADDQGRHGHADGDGPRVVAEKVRRRVAVVERQQPFAEVAVPRPIAIATMK